MSDEIIDAEYTVENVDALDPTKPLPKDHPEYDYLPDRDVGKRPPGKYCTARLKQPDPENGKFYCAKPAGSGTDNDGIGRCKLHGGSSLVKHGFYSQVRRYDNVKGSLGELYKQYLESDEDPHDINPELAMLRAIIADQIANYEKFKEALLTWRMAYAANNEQEPPKLNMPHLSAYYKMLDAVSKMVDRERRHKEAFAISLKELYRLMAGLGNDVRDVMLDDSLSDQQKLKEINKRWSKRTPK